MASRRGEERELARRLSRLLAQRQRRMSEDEQRAIELAMIALAFLLRDDLIADAAWSDTERAKEAREAIKAAHSALVGGAVNGERDTLIAGIDEAVRFGALHGWRLAADAFVATHGYPKRLASQLADRLASHVVRSKRGRLPRGKETTPTIAEWLTRDPLVAKHARRMSRRRK